MRRGTERSAQISNFKSLMGLTQLCDLRRSIALAAPCRLQQKEAIRDSTRRRIVHDVAVHLLTSPLDAGGIVDQIATPSIRWERA